MCLAQEGEMANEKFFSEPRENSQIKATIIAKYFVAWAKIIGSRAEKIAYIDLFAGPGRYEDDTKSTPLLVLERAINDPLLKDRLVSVFNDAEGQNVTSLSEEIAKLPGIDTLKFKPVVDNQSVGDETANALQKMSLVPTLCFFDPFGYKGLSLKLINAVLKDWACECVFFFNYNRVNMGITNDRVRGHMEALFGKERVEKLQPELDGMNAADRELRVIEELAKALKELGGKYVLPFRFRNEKGNRTSHHLVFVSKHSLGYGIMKEIMAGMSSKHEQGVPSFEYSSADARFPVLFELNRPLDDLEGMLLDAFAGQTLRMVDIYERHHVDRRFIKANYKDVLRKLEEKTKIATDPPAEKRKKQKDVRTFGDGVNVTFPRKA
jgi:three-Cys-motif partner protein